MIQILTIFISICISIISVENKYDDSQLQANVEIVDCNSEVLFNEDNRIIEQEQGLTESTSSQSKQTELDEVLIDRNLPEVETVSVNKSTIETLTKAPEMEVIIKDLLEQKADHSQFNNLLKRFVSDQGTVDYVGLKKSEADLDRYLDYLKSNPAASLSRDERLAFWINAYNAFTLKLIVSNYPIASITDLEGGKPWDKKWINIGDRTYSLNQIENKIIRPKFNDARIHFAVNCAAKSCPPLANVAFTATNLESLLERRTKAFINNPKYTQVTAKGTSVSKIFEWYAEDFGNIRDYIAKYYNGGLPKANIGYMEYDWSLNGR